MKRRSFFYGMAALLLTIVCSMGLTSCVVEDGDFWPFSPPPGWGSNYFYDNRLEGSWELSQVNSSGVRDDQVNYMEFYGGGRGRYYYYLRGYAESEKMGYFCQRSGSTTTNYQINIQYENGEASTMAYWFTDNERTLWLQWKLSDGQVMTYLYSRVPYVP
ncbi:MAG: hypothetical protein K2J63_05300 [Muribaculaceae bacterium]|nr:hypothetical protein [Muribaculaceae bacterium]MDE6794704.1 hypothetical protein [Muribaculaceae bacterium]